VAFRVGLTREMLLPDGRVVGEAELAALEQDGIEWSVLPEAAPLADAAERLALLAAHGIGFDAPDLALCTERGVAVTVTPRGGWRPLAGGAVAFLVALAYRIVDKDRAAREPGWPGRFVTPGRGLAGRTLGVIALGSAAREIARLVEPFGVRVQVYGPRRAIAAAAVGGEAISLEELLRGADFVCVACPLTEETHHLLDAERLALMKPTAQLLSVGEGGVVDEQALADALRDGRLAGAALDAFEEEPLAGDSPLHGLDNVLLAPHAIGYVEDAFAESLAAVRAVSAGRAPETVANPAVLGRPEFLAKLRRYAG
jgi:phosphoglycerate dehydrogenase-like enzyme